MIICLFLLLLVLCNQNEKTFTAVVVHILQKKNSILKTKVNL